MKELSIEEKAKAYDKAIKRLEDIETGKCQKTFIFTEGLFGYIFPELKESEDKDKAVLDALIRRLEGDNVYVSPHLAAECLKSLRDRYYPKNTWKPSDEQMITLRHVISGCSYDIEPLVEIEEHLKKLKG